MSYSEEFEMNVTESDSNKKRKSDLLLQRNYNQNFMERSHSPSKLHSNTTVINMSFIDPNDDFRKHSVIIIHKCLNNISNSWEWISSARDRKSFVFKEENLEKVRCFMETNQLNIGQLNVRVSFTENKTMNRVKGIFYCPELIAITDEDVMEELKDQNVLEFYRFKKPNRNGEMYQTGLYSATFKGTTRPEYLNISFVRVKVSASYQRPLQCNHCFVFGHSKKNCNKSDLNICPSCSSEMEKDTEHNCTIKCVNCQDSHPSLSKSCPQYIFEQDVIYLKTDQCLSYPEAKRRMELRKGSTTYAEAADRGNLASKVIELQKVIQTQSNEIKMKTKKINQLEAGMKSQSVEIKRLKVQADKSVSLEVELSQLKEDHQLVLYQTLSKHSEILQEATDNTNALEVLNEQLRDKNAAISRKLSIDSELVDIFNLYIKKKNLTDDFKSFLDKHRKSNENKNLSQTSSSGEVQH